MGSCLIWFTLTAGIPAQDGSALPSLVNLHQAAPRPHPKLKLPLDHGIGPVIPGLAQGAVPQGLAWWPQQNWFLISLYFPEGNRPSVVVAVNAATGRVVRCLTLVDSGGNAFCGHVGGLAVSEQFLWIGSGEVYRAPLTAVASAKEVDHLRLMPSFRAECNASYVAFHNDMIWVGEFVAVEEGFRGVQSHYMKDRNGAAKYAWVAGYKLDAQENLESQGGPSPAPGAILSIRQKVQGMTFADGRIVLSTSYGRNKNSTLAAYINPVLRDPPHGLVRLSGERVPMWFLDGQNRDWELDDFAPMSEGIALYGERIAVICESGAEKYQSGGKGPLDTVVLLKPPYRASRVAR